MPEVPEVLEVPDGGAGRDATGGAAAVGGFAAWRVGAGAVARCRKLANIAPTLLPSAETFPPIADPTPVIVDHFGSGTSGWNHQ